MCFFFLVFFFSCSIIRVRILFFLPFRMFVDLLDYFKCRKDSYPKFDNNLDICYSIVINIYLTSKIL